MIIPITTFIFLSTSCTGSIPSLFRRERNIRFFGMQEIFDRTKHTISECFDQLLAYKHHVTMHVQR